ncbi:succinyl-diaminopimelate desuccinylase [Martelella sp. AD-3]|uniref:succinyl-diaminopimelate desuccinylase n=1 Tax=Martelella sp. AD-3 TaxID=686597 RepID=UPI000465D143|nr:succinyl-diaminopimelate desuccinylase [Martelella sp. AD-3]AMM85088.1 succinyl-diaminopimelate desuccinylase [Martelella sp. AD-3]MAM13952.1 succinyl-diaminopimelate desuccinylase [Rhizobiaceae bacterium]
MKLSDPVSVLQTLVRCPSVTPEEGGALSALEAMLTPLGFSVERMTGHTDGTPDVENLYARLGTSGPHLMFAGHTDVVPPGNAASWRHPPFSGEIADGLLFGRGAVDMKGGIACFIAALARLLDGGQRLSGSVSLLITGDEEGPGINGTEKLLEWARARGEQWDAALVGEPTNPDTLGDMIKVGRRGSLTGRLTVTGTQGHVAYPHLADNPLRAMTAMLDALMGEPLDHGTDLFPPSNLEVTSVDTGNAATNVIPESVSATFNIRFNDLWSEETLKDELTSRLNQAAADGKLRPGRAPALFSLEWLGRVSPVFLTRNERLSGSLAAAVETVTGRRPALSTTGGTSDARFIKDYCPVVEFGLVGQTMHKVDEHVPVADLEMLTDIYGHFIERWFALADAR